MADTDKITVTVDEETIEWIQETYPEALSKQEAIRMAISDARLIRQNRDVFVMEKEDIERISE